jgi:hypothetical protein
MRPTPRLPFRSKWRITGNPNILWLAELPKNVSSCHISPIKLLWNISKSETILVPFIFPAAYPKNPFSSKSFPEFNPEN